jgi:hypothetical protein
VTWIETDGRSWEFAKTATHWNGHKNPIWEHTCRGHPLTGYEQVEFTVMERNLVLANSFIGSARIATGDLLVNGSAQAMSDSFEGQSSRPASVTGTEYKLNLLKKGKEQGTVTVQASLAMTTSVGVPFSSEVELTRLADTVFHSPVQPIKVSGGTAPFFSLLLKDTSCGLSPSYYIGKDLARAEDEVTFYEEARQLSTQPGGGGLGPMLDYLFEYRGVFSSYVENAKPDDRPKELLVFENLRDGCMTLRMLDIKVGQKNCIQKLAREVTPTSFAPGFCGWNDQF